MYPTLFTNKLKTKNPTPIKMWDYFYITMYRNIVLVQPLNVAEVLTMWQLVVLRVHTNTCLE